MLSASAWGCLTAATPLLTSLGSTHLLFLSCSRALTGLLQGKECLGLAPHVCALALPVCVWWSMRVPLQAQAACI